MIRAAVERGVTFFDTAEVYGPYTTKRSSARRSSPCATRWRSRRSSAWNLERKDARRRQPAVDDPRAASRTSLKKRLRTDRIDLFYQHRVDPDVPIDDVAGIVTELIDEGKVEHFGLSEAGVAHDPTRPRRAAGDGAAK